MMHVFHVLRCLKNKNDEIDKAGYTGYDTEGRITEVFVR